MALLVQLSLLVLAELLVLVRLLLLVGGVVVVVVVADRCRTEREAALAALVAALAAAVAAAVDFWNSCRNSSSFSFCSTQHTHNMLDISVL